MGDYRSEAIWARAEGRSPHAWRRVAHPVTARIETVVLEMPSSNGPCGVATGLLVNDLRSLAGGEAIR